MDPPKHVNPDTIGNKSSRSENCDPNCGEDRWHLPHPSIKEISGWEDWLTEPVTLERRMGSRKNFTSISVRNEWCEKAPDTKDWKLKKCEGDDETQRSQKLLRTKKADTRTKRHRLRTKSLGAQVGLLASHMRCFQIRSDQFVLVVVVCSPA